MADGQEKEIKLVSTTAGREKLFQLPLFQDKLIEGSRQTLTLVNRYYDTRDRKLTAAGMAYRIRQTNGKDLEATVKTRGKTVNGFSQRGEYTIPLTKEEPVLSGFEAQLDQKLQTLLADDELLPLFTVDVTREIALMRLSAVTVVELAVDRGFITADGKTASIDEIELELKKGQEKELLHYTAALAGEIPLLPEEKSKFRRGMELLGYTAFKKEVPAWPSCSPEDAPAAVWQALLQQQAALCLDLLKERITNGEELFAGEFSRALAACGGLWQLGRPLLSRSSWQKGRQLLERSKAMLLPLEGINQALVQAMKPYPEKLFSLKPAVQWLENQQEQKRKEIQAFQVEQAGAALWQVLYLSYLARDNQEMATIAQFRQKAWNKWQQEEILLGENGSLQPMDREDHSALLAGLFLLEKAAGDKRLFRRAGSCLREWGKFRGAYLSTVLCGEGAKKAKGKDLQLALAMLVGLLCHKFIKTREKFSQESRGVLKEIRKNRELCCFGKK